ncbi:MAG: PAS domain S-box protein [Candidatus Krumholzibacteriota bacterium]|nr:PAS domain S-box protein [Candidatus Krumholzibacteriota bacterium]
MSRRVNNSRKQIRSGRMPIILVLGLGLVAILAIVYIQVTTTRISREYIPLAEAVKEIKYESVIGHLWFEEMISGDRNEEIDDVFAHIDLAASYAKAMLDGDSISGKRIFPLSDIETRIEIEEVRAKLSQFRAIAEQRWAAIDSSQIGSEIDQRFDMVFRDFLDRANRVEARFGGKIADDLKKFHFIQNVLIVFLLGLFSLAGLFFWRYEKSKTSGMMKLQLSEERYRGLIEDIPVMICRFLPDGTIRYVNKAYCDYFGKAPEELVGSSFLDLIPEEDRKTVIGNIRSLTPERPTQSHEHKVINPDGEVCWQRWTNRALFDDRGIAMAYQAVGEDITERRTAAKAIEESRRLLNDMGDIARIGGWEMDLESGGKAAWTKGTYDIVELDEDEKLPGLNEHIGWYLPEYREMVREKIDRLIKTKKPIHYEAAFKTRSGVLKWCRVFGEAVEKDGNVVKIRGTFQDITDFKQVQIEQERLIHEMNERVKEQRCIYGVAEAIRNRESLDQIFEDVVALIPMGWQYPMVTCARLIFGEKEYLSEGFTDSKWKQASDIIVHGNLRGSITVCYREERPESYEGPFLREERELLDTIANTLGEAIERFRAEHDLKRLSHAIEQAAETIVITDTAGAIEYANPAFERITGYSISDAIGKNPRILKSGEHGEQFYREMWKTLTSGSIWAGWLVNKKKDGTFYTEEATISPVRDTSGAIVNYVGVKRDITENLRLEEQYNQGQKVESIGRLAGGVAHDLNNLLSPILGYSEMLLDDIDQEDPRKESVSEIIRAGYRARDLVHQLLAFSRKQTLEYKLIDLNDILDGIEKLIRRTIREDIEIVISPSPDIGMIRADTGQIEQVILNLVSNAQDAMPDGGKLALSTRQVETDTRQARRNEGIDPGIYVMLSVSDTGIGMDRDIRGHIFEPFFSTKGEAGTGLGLSTAYGIIKQHGGNVLVESEPGKGTTFEVYLPVSDDPLDKGKIFKKKPENLEGTEKILLVEDNENVRNLTETILKRKGYFVLVAENGEEAFEILKNQKGPVDLLLTDVVMSGINGRELYIRASEEYPGLKVLFMSGYSYDVIANRGVLEEGMSFIQKPFTIDALATKIRDVLEER